MTLKEIVEQLESCGYECEAGPLTSNVAFISLKEMSEPLKAVKHEYSERYQRYCPNCDNPLLSEHYSEGTQEYWYERNNFCSECGREIYYE